jgi:dCTP deaminase
VAVVGRKEIELRLRMDLDDPASLVITPLLDEDDAFDADSVDLRLGRNFLLPKNLQKPHYCPDSQSRDTLYTETFVPFGRYLVVPAHQTVLGATLEFIKLPLDLCGEILTKSSVARTFILIETAPWVHPGYRGCLTLEIANVSNTPVLLYPGRLIGQLILLHLDQGTSTKREKRKILKSTLKPDGKLSPTYFGPIYPEGPKFNDPGKDLEKIGIQQTWTIVEKVSSAHRDPIQYLQMAVENRQRRIDEIKSYSAERLNAIFKILRLDVESDAIDSLIDAAVMQMTFTEPVFESDTGWKGLVTGIVDTPNETFGRGGMIAGHSIKPGNIRLKVKDVFRLTITTAKSLHDPSPLSLSALFIALWEFASTVKVPLTVLDLIILRAMWELGRGERSVSTDEVLQRANLDLASQNLPLTTDQSLKAALDHLQELHCIEGGPKPNTWVVLEEIIYEYQ